jgi:hypothetical protein
MLFLLTNKTGYTLQHFCSAFWHRSTPPSFRIHPSAMPFFYSLPMILLTVPITVDAAGWLAPFFLLVQLCYLNTYLG